MQRLKGLSILSIGLVLCLVGAPTRAADCNGNGVEDVLDIASGDSYDCNFNEVPDECDVEPGSYLLEVSRVYTPEGEGLPTPTMHFPVLADLDGDGDLDISVPIRSVTRRVGGRVGPEWVDLIAVYLNSGDGLFTQDGLYETGMYPSVLVTSDIDGDGDLDIVSQNGSNLLDAQDKYTLTVLRNRGNGSFDPSETIALPDNPRSLTVVDLDGVNGPDVVFDNLGNDTVTVVLNEGGGKFSAPTHYASGSNPRALTAADLNGDGHLDIAVVNSGRSDDSPLSSSVSVYFNRGDGTFGAAVAVQVGDRPLDMEAADVDGDGAIDLLTANARSDDVSVLLNRGDGTFEPARSHPVGGHPTFLAVSDLSGDGFPDVVATSWGYSDNNDVSILLNQGGGRFALAVNFHYPENEPPRRVVMADIDGDGDLDVITPAGPRLAVIHNEGSGTFAAPVMFGVDFENRSGVKITQVGDLDGDGDPDVVVGRSNSFSVLLNRASEEAVVPGCAEFVRGDVNADGQVSISDIITFRRWRWFGLERLSCADAADVIDDDRLDICDHLFLLEALFLTPDWTTTMPEPFPDPGMDPTPLAIPGRMHGCPDLYSDTEGDHRSPIGCGEYDVQPPERSDDLVELGDVTAGPGQTIKIPVVLSSTLPVDGVQLVVAYDSSLLEIESSRDGEPLSFEGTHFEGVEPYYQLTTHPSSGVFTLALAGSLFLEGYEIPPGEGTLIAWIVATVAVTAQPDTAISVTPVDSDGGVGPYHLRNELSFRGNARFVSMLPNVDGGVLQIVGDQSVFIRGDSNHDERLNISDAIHTLGWLFLGYTALTCKDAADTNDNGEVTMTDAIALLVFLFQGKGSIPAPYPEPGADPTADFLFCYASET